MLTIPFILMVLATFVSLASVLCHLALPTTLRALGSVDPVLRSYLLMLVAGAPWLIGTGLLISSTADIVFGACDWGDACLWNEDPTIVNSRRALVAAPLVLATATVGLRILWRNLAAGGAVRALRRLSEPGEAPGVRYVATDAAIAFAGRGDIYISRTVRETLSDKQFEAVILHERAHLQRRDGLFQPIAGLLASCYLPTFRRRILNALTAANEQACDAHAAAIVGPATVASAILAVARMRGAAATLPHPGFADNFVAARVHRLLNIEPAAGGSAGLRAILVLTLLSAFLIGDVLYYLAMMILYPSA